jgi:hypothetical protein
MLTLQQNILKSLFVVQITTHTTRALLVDTIRGERISFEAPTPSELALFPLDTVRQIAALNGNLEGPPAILASWAVAQVEFYTQELPPVSDLVLLSDRDTQDGPCSFSLS